MKFQNKLKTLKIDQKWSFWDPKMSFFGVFGLFQNFTFELAARINELFQNDPNLSADRQMLK